MSHIISRRLRLGGITPATAHAGLWLDRYLPVQEVKDVKSRLGDNDTTLTSFGIDARKVPTKADFMREVAALGEPSNYPYFFGLHGATIDALALPDKPAVTAIEISGRLAIGLGVANVVENGVALHRTYGMPYLLGSGLKGLAARFARQRLTNPETKSLDPRWSSQGEFYKVVFGAADDSGFVNFHDALPLPGQSNLLVPDVLTPHHRDYYGGQDKPPADWDSPVPIPFLSVRGKFQLALTGPPEWTRVALDILISALQQEGAGAKTSSGYGRIK